MIRIIQNWVKTIDIKSSRTYQVVVLRILQTDCLNRRVSLKRQRCQEVVFSSCLLHFDETEKFTLCWVENISG